MKAKSKVRAIHVHVAAEVLESVFEECDRYDLDETGGSRGRPFLRRFRDAGAAGNSGD